MKIELTMQLDIPSGEIDGSSDAEIRQLLFDQIQNRLVVTYSEWAVRAAAHFTPLEARDRAVEIYNIWADIIRDATWDFRRLS